MYKIIITWLFLFQISSASEAQIVLRRAIVIPVHIDSIIDFEKKLSLHYSTPAPAGQNWFEYRRGTKPILFIAAHATSQIREGDVKPPDAGTGSLARELHVLRDVHVLYTTYQSPSDPNFYDNNAFKDSLSKLVKAIKPRFVIDLHGSHPYRPYDVDFGTLHGKSYLLKKRLFDSLSVFLYRNGLVNQSLDFFPAETNQTITKFVYKKGYPCVQLEINSTYLSADDGDLYAQRTAQLLQSLIQFIDYVLR